MITSANRLKPVYVTQRGLERLEQELEQLKTAKRRDLAERLHEVIEDGELDENAAYETLKNEQAFLEGRILDLEGLIGRARLIRVSEDPGKVSLGSSVELQSPDGAVERFTLVGAAEADPRHGYISYASPLGSALLDKTSGEEVTFQTPDGMRRYLILSVLSEQANPSPGENS
jgi:transcription elongation factor GreA